MQWSKDDGYTPSFQTLIIPCLPRFEKLALLQFQVYIETETMTHFFVCCDFQKTILIRSSEGKKNCILHMLRIHTGFLKLSKKYIYYLHLKTINPFEIGKPCIIIAGREMIFEQYIIALKRDKYYIEFQNDDTIKRNLLLFDLMQQTFNRLDGLYLHEKSLLIDTII